MGDVASTYPPGPVYEVADRALGSLDLYGRYRAGHVTQRAFAAGVLANKAHLVDLGLAPADVHFATRFPADPIVCARRIVADLVKVGILDHAGSDPSPFSSAEGVAREMDHGPYSTYIYPEEALALHLITASIRPRRTVFCGSYYGYWAMWALAAVHHSSDVVLIDPDAAACRVAAQNLKAFGYDSFARVVVGDAVEELPRLGMVDLIVIDAETPESEPDLRRRGKGIYTALLSVALDAMSNGGVVVFHNVVQHHFNEDSFFVALIRRYEREYGAMLKTAGSELAAFHVYPTTEGLAVGRSRR